MNGLLKYELVFCAMLLILFIRRMVCFVFRSFFMRKYRKQVAYVVGRTVWLLRLFFVRFCYWSILLHKVKAAQNVLQQKT